MCKFFHTAFFKLKSSMGRWTLLVISRGQIIYQIITIPKSRTEKVTLGIRSHQQIYLCPCKEHIIVHHHSTNLSNWSIKREISTRLNIPCLKQYQNRYDQIIIKLKCTNNFNRLCLKLTLTTIFIPANNQGSALIKDPISLPRLTTPS